MPTLYINALTEFEPIVAVASALPGVTVESVPGYSAITADGALVIDRRLTGVRHAVWYSCVAAVAAGTVVQFDKDALRVEPIGTSGAG